MKRSWPRISVCLVVLLRLAPAAAASDRTQLAARAQAIVADASYQKQLVAKPKLPENEILKPPPAGPWGDLSRILLIAGVILLLGLLALWTLAAFKRRSALDVATEDASAAGAATKPAWSLAEVESLARRGSFSEAAHLLLLLTVAQLSTFQRTMAPESFTARELVPVLPQSPKQRLMFQELVAAVERSLFGGQPLDASGFQHCLELHRMLLA